MGAVMLDILTLANEGEAVPGLWFFNGRHMAPRLVRKHNTWPATAVICAWCPDALARTKAASDAGKFCSHTICGNCMEQALAEDSTEKTWRLYWSPSGQFIGEVTAPTKRAAVRKASQPYRKFLGEIYAVEVK